MDSVIKKVFAEEIKDSTGRPTLKVTVQTDKHSVEALVPSGQSRGSNEAIELRDRGGGMKKAIKVIEDKISPAFVGKNPDQNEIDKFLLELDGTKDKSNLGGNVMIGVSVAVAKVFAKENSIPLWRSIALHNKTYPKIPALFMNIINGGVHAGFRIPFQEHMIVVREGTARKSYDLGNDIFKKLGEVIQSKVGKVPMGDEGGYSPVCGAVEEPFEFLKQATHDKTNVYFAIDAAASGFFKAKKYNLINRKYSAEELMGVYKTLVKKFPLKSIEDPFEEKDIEAFKKITSELGDEISIVGDDLTVTNPKRIASLSTEKTANAVIIKPNQIGTLSEVFDAVKIAHSAGWKTIVSHRSGDTMDSFIADLAVGVGAYGIKAGSPEPPERKVKYERLIEIDEKELML